VDAQYGYDSAGNRTSDNAGTAYTLGYGDQNRENSASPSSTALGMISKGM